MANSGTRLAFYLGLTYAYELVRDDLEGGYFIQHPELPGCVAQGETADEATTNLDRARALWIQCRLEDGLPIPEPAGRNYLGRIDLRVPASLHESLAAEAKAKQVSLNLHLNTLMAEFVQGLRPLAQSRMSISEMPTSEIGGRESVFISYSHRDREWVERFQTMLMPLVRLGLLVWDDKMIASGRNWRDEIETALDKAKVGLLLVTPNFLASDFITCEEVPALLRATKQEGVRIVWVAVSASLYMRTAIGEFQCANDPSKPLDSLPKPEQNRVIAAICEDIQRELE